MKREWNTEDKACEWKANEVNTSNLLLAVTAQYRGIEQEAISHESMAN